MYMYNKEQGEFSYLVSFLVSEQKPSMEQFQSPQLNYTS